MKTKQLKTEQLLNQVGSFYGSNIYIYIYILFSCLNLKPDDEFLPYRMTEVFDKTGHGFTDIITALR